MIGSRGCVQFLGSNIGTTGRMRALGCHLVSGLSILRAMSSNDLAVAQVSHSVLHAEWLARQVALRYPVDGEVSGFLLYRGMNDVYLMQDRRTRMALRVWRRSWRDVDAVRYELEFLDFLRSRDFPASTPLRTRDGELYFKVQSPEGERAVALYTWAPGRKFGEALDEGTAARIGAAFAQMHLLGLEHARGHRFTTDDAVGFMVNLPPLLEFLYDRPEDARDYAALAPRLVERLQALGAQGVPLGICHRDFHPSNVHVTDSGAITLLDFDAAGEDFLMQDVENFVWGNLFYGFSPRIGESFKQGYATVRPFTQAESDNSELFLMAKAFRLVAGMAHSSVAVGRGTLRFRSLDWLGEYIRSRARLLGLL
jgi:Ser/Thr protein kinase RdoA (MazF antagonist)